MEPRLKQVFEDQVYFLDEYNVSKINTWDKIYENRGTYFIDANPGLAYIQYPGIVISNEKFFDDYLKEIYFKLNFHKEFTLPRGNLSNNLEYIFIGIKPGSPPHGFYDIVKKVDVTLCIGQVSKMLHRLLVESDIFPYFTNIYKSHDAKQDGNVDKIVKEVNFIHNYFPNITLVVMGNYNEFKFLRQKIDTKIKMIKIYHPSYLVRSYTKDKFNKWKEQLKYELNEL